MDRLIRRGFLLANPASKILVKDDIKYMPSLSHIRLFGTTGSAHSEDIKNDKPIKFTTSDAHLNYRASKHFYNEPSKDLPKSHNFVLATTGILGVFYLIYIRDDIDDNQGALNLAKPIYELQPKFAIPIIESMITDSRRHGRSTKELQEKLAFYMQNPEAHGGEKQAKTLKEK